MPGVAHRAVPQGAHAEVASVAEQSVARRMRSLPLALTANQWCIDDGG